MSSGDIDPLYIGQHCSTKTCGTLDFLPFTCPFCEKVYCKTHHTPHFHNCDKVPEKERKTGTDYKSSEPCHVCQHADIVNVVCEECQGVCCMSHRTLEQHNCKILPVNNPPKPETPASVLITSTAKGVNLKRKGAKSVALERKVMLMKMKNKSCGPSSVPIPERLFLNVTHADGNCYYHFSCSWSVGRCVDHVAGYLKMRNNNDKAGCDMLVMCREGAELPMSELVASQTASGDTVQLKYIAHS